MSVQVLDTITNQDQNILREQFAIDILKGFSADVKYIPSKYFYDEEGSVLFEKITNLEEYYPTRCEAEVFETYKSVFSKTFRHGNFNLVELGAGDGKKTRILLDEFTQSEMDFEYISVDISESSTQELDQKLGEQFPQLKHTGVVGEYIDAIKWIDGNRPGTKVVLFLGSNIGNFDRAQAVVFLRVLWKHLNHGDYLLIGFDLKKDINTMTKAYNDSSNVTRDFNLNVLKRINSELGGNFDISQFMHYGCYNPILGAMESYLISTKEQWVRIEELEKSFHFNAFEPIHLEYSNKYLIEDIEYFAKETGFEIEEQFIDSKTFFVDSLWRVKKEIAPLR